MALLGVSFLLLLAVVILFEPLQPLSKVLMGLWVIVAAAALGRLKLLVKDWLVFVAFLYLLDLLRGTVYALTCKLGLPAYVLYVLKSERALFGEVPSVVLQNLLLRPDPAGHFTWLEKTLTVFYGSHFIVFLFVGLFVWMYRPEALAKYKTSFYFLISAGILVYALVPTAPPWMASSQFGLLPPLTRFNSLILNSTIPVITGGFDLNPISAMPSLHAGFPILCSFLLWALYRWKALPFFLYTLIVLFTIVFTGDHYVMDVLAGLALAVICYLLAGRLLKRANRSREPGAADAGPPGAGVPAAGPGLLPGVRASTGWVDLKKPLIVGGGMFLAALVFGWVNGALAAPGVDYRDPNVPRFVELFGREDQYRASYPVQLYFGNHALAWKDYGTALRYFERSLGLAVAPAESREIQIKIDVCRRKLGFGQPQRPD